jgi:hypothetical protein
MQEMTTQPLQLCKIEELHYILVYMCVCVGNQILIDRISHPLLILVAESARVRFSHVYNNLNF